MNKIELCNINTCTQCYSCASVCPKKCISFTVGKEGFLEPVIDKDVCIECGLCMNSCHQISPIKKSYFPFHVYAAWTYDDVIRCKSSSGGVFSEIALYVL